MNWMCYLRQSQGDIYILMHTNAYTTCHLNSHNNCNRSKLVEDCLRIRQLCMIFSCRPISIEGTNSTSKFTATHFLLTSWNYWHWLHHLHLFYYFFTKEYYLVFIYLPWKWTLSRSTCLHTSLIISTHTLHVLFQTLLKYISNQQTVERWCKLLIGRK